MSRSDHNPAATAFGRAGRQPRPLDAKRLEELAIAYVGRYATTRAKLETYLARKLDQRGWAGETRPELGRLVGRLVELGYVDDRAFAEMRAASLARRGYGRRRIESSLRAAGIADDDRGAPARLDEQAALAAALALARRRRIGPYGPQPADRAARERAIAILLRGGHDYDLARAVAALTPSDSDVKDRE